MTTAEYEQLVEFLGRRFAEIDGRFAEIDGRFTQIDGRFVQIDGRLAESDGHFAQMDRRFAQIDGRFGRIEDQIAGLRRDILAHFDEIYRRLERLEQEYHAITQALRRIEVGLADERGRRQILERDLAALKEHVTTLQARIEEIEERLGRGGD